MPLSEEEQRILSEIESQLRASDPDLARQVGSTTIYSHALRQLRWGIVGFIAAFLGGLGIAVRRLMLPEVRILTDFKDVLLLVLTLTLLGSGIVASHNPANYSFWITLHVLCGVIVLLAAPFTKLAHIALFFCTRIQLGMDFGIKRGGMKSNFDW